MRSISPDGLAKLATRLGTEPIFIIEVDWAGNGTYSAYADRDVAGINGRILDVTELDNVVDILSSNSSQEITVTLDDTDGTIKDLFDTYDPHQRRVNVYQFFGGLDLSDRFLLFQGQVTSPIVWSEGDRTVTFSVLSQLEDREFGFSAEEGQFPFVPKDLVGKPWPVIFGTAIDVPALQVNKAVSGSTLCGVGILSGADLHNRVPLGAENCTLGMSLAMLSANIGFLSVCAASWERVDAGKADEMREQANEMRRAIADAVENYARQRLCAQSQRQAKINPEESEGCNPVRILGGEDFPQNRPITLNINGGLFTGTMVNDAFFISTRQHPENEQKAQDAFDKIEPQACRESTPAQHFDLVMDVPCGEGDHFNLCQIRRRGIIICTQDATSRPTATQVAQHFWAEPGSRVVMASDEPITYIVSITPGTVLAVKAYKTFNGVRRLVSVPNDLWFPQVVNYGPVTAVQVVLRKPLSSIVDQGWSDEIYVTFKSTIGPNTVDILKYIIGNYTNLTWDDTSFDAVRAQVAPFPMNFPVLERKNTIEIIKEIAFQARCAVWISNGKFYLKYLPAEPSADVTLTESDIQNKSIQVHLTPTEDLVTKMVVTWRLSWATEDPEKIILRHNVNKYGTKEQQFDFYCFNQPDIVLKAATFWLIRKSNTWKRIRFRTFLNHLNLETFDTVNLNFAGGYVATGAVKAIVESAEYNSNEHLIDFECWTPVKAGEKVPYIFAWPSAITATFPTAAEIAAGNAGGNGIGANATGQLPIGFTDGIGQTGTVFVGGPNVVFLPQSDRGDRTPGDVGFQAQTVLPDDVYAEVDPGTNPNPDLSLNYVDPLPPPVIPPLPAGGITIDIRRTRIIDSENPDDTAFLASIIERIRQGEIILTTGAKFSDGSQEAEFDFKFDPEGGKFGAGTAFLKD